jgi:hypothetical protein
MKGKTDSDYQADENKIESLVKARYPQRWFENLWLSGSLICLLTYTFHTYYYIPVIGLYSPILLSVTTLSIYVITTLCDLITTQQGMRLNKVYEELGYELPIRESNMLLPDYLPAKRYWLSIPGLITVAGAVYVFFVPSVGIGACLLRLMASLVNIRVRRRAEFELQLLETTLK